MKEMRERASHHVKEVRAGILAATASLTELQLPGALDGTG